jgi:hypothetical protein
MLFDILKAVGLDVRAKIAEARAEFDNRVELAKARVSRAVTTASMLAVLFVLSGLAALAAIGVGLGALYSWVAVHYGQFYGYAAVGVLLIVVSAVLATVGILKVKSWSAEPANLPPDEKLERTVAKEPRDEIPVGAAAEPAPGVDVAPVAVAAPRYAPTTGSAFSEALAPFVSKFIRIPGTGHPAVDDLIDALRGPAQGAAEDVIRSTANTIRYGEREKLIAILGTAVFVGWLLEQVRSRQATNV